jgi:hypothetical protein
MESIFLIIVLFYGIDLLIASVFIFDLTKRGKCCIEYKTCVEFEYRVSASAIPNRSNPFSLRRQNRAPDTEAAYARGVKMPTRPALR